MLTAFLLASGLALFFPATSFAHAELLRSDPQDGTALRVAPTRIRMWFSEALDRSPTFSGAVVIDAANRSVDMHDARIVSADAREMDVSLIPRLPSGNYKVAWFVASARDGHLITGTINFTVAQTNGTVPASGTPFNTPAVPPFVAFIITTLLELAAIFWVGLHLFQQFVLQSVTEEHEELREMNSHVQHKGELLALVTLMLLLFVNSGLLLEQVVAIAVQNNIPATNSALWVSVLTSGQFGFFWFVRELLIVLALRLAFVPLQAKQPLPIIKTLLSWGNLLLGLALFLTIASTSYIALETSSLIVYVVLADFLHLLAAALWVGGILFIGSCYLPILHKYTPREQAYSLITLLPIYSPWAIVGVVLMAITGPFIATVPLNGWEQLFTTLYGQVLTAKILLVSALLLASAFHILLLRPRLQKAHLTFLTTTRHAQEKAMEGENTPLPLAEQVKSNEQVLIKQVRRLKRILWWEAGIGIGILICVGLMNVLAGTLQP